MVATIGGVEVKKYEYEYEDYETKETKTNFIHYVDYEDIPEEYRDEFNEWMHGQTMPIIPGVEFAIYSWDWERFYNMRTKGIPTYWD